MNEVERKRLNDLRAKEQALRGAAGLNRSVNNPSHQRDTPEQEFSPPSLQDLKRSRSRDRREVSKPPERTRSISVPRSVPQEETKTSKADFRARIEHALSPAKTRNVIIPRRAISSVGMDHSMSKKVEPKSRARSESPVLVRGGHYSVLTHAAPRASDASPAPVKRSQYFTGNLFEEEGQEGPSEREQQAVQAAEDAGKLVQDLSQRLADQQAAQQTMLRSIDGMMNINHEALEAYEFIIKRHYDTQRDLSLLLESLPNALSSAASSASASAPPAQALHHAVHEQVHHIASSLTKIDVIALQYWFPSRSDRLVTLNSKCRELSTNLLGQHPDFRVMLSSTQPLVLRRDDKKGDLGLFDDLHFAVQGGLPAGKEVDKIFVYRLHHSNGQHPALLLAITTPPAKPTADRDMLYDVLPAMQDSNILRVSEYLHSFQHLVQKLFLDQTANALQGVLDRIEHTQQHHAQHAEVQQKDTELQSKQALLTLSLLLSEQPSTINQITTAILKSCTIFPKVWVYITKRHSVYDESSNMNNFFHDSAVMLAIRTAGTGQRLVNESIQQLNPLQQNLILSQPNALEELRVARTSEEFAFLFDSLDTSNLAAVHSSNQLNLLRYSFELSGNVHATILAELPEEKAHEYEKTHVQDIVTIARQAYGNHHSTVQKSILNDMQSVPKDIYAHASALVMSMLSNRSMSPVDALIDAADFLQSKPLCSKLHVKKCKLLFSSELAESFGLDCGQQGEQFVYLKHKTVYTAQAEGNSNWLQDLFANKTVLYTPGQYKPIHRRMDEYSSTSLQASRLSLYNFIASLFTEFKSALLVPLQTHRGLAVMVLIDYTSGLAADAYNGLCFDQIFTQQYAEALANNAQVAESVIALFHQLGQLGNLIAETVHHRDALQHMEEDDSQTADKMRLTRVFQRWKATAVKSAQQRTAREESEKWNILMQLLLFRHNFKAYNGTCTSAVESIKASANALGDMEAGAFLNKFAGLIKPCFDHCTVLVYPSQLAYHADMVKRDDGRADILGEVFHYCQLSTQTSSFQQHLINAQTAQLRSQQCIGYVCLMRRDGAFAAKESHRFQELCKLAGIVYSCLAIGTEKEDSGPDPMLLQSIVPCLLSLQTTTSNDDSDMVDHIISLLLQWMQRTSHATAITCTLKQQLLNCESDRRYTSMDETVNMDALAKEITKVSAMEVIQHDDQRALRIKLFNNAANATDSVGMMELLYPSANQMDRLSGEQLVLFNIMFYILINSCNIRNLLIAKNHSLHELQDDKRTLEQNLTAFQGSLHQRNQDIKESNQESNYLYKLLLFVINLLTTHDLHDMANAVWDELAAVLGCHSVLLALDEGYLDNHSAVLGSSFQIIWPTGTAAGSADFPNTISLNQLCNIPQYFSNDTGKQFVIKLSIPGQPDAIYGALIVFVNAAKEGALMQYKEVLTMLLSLLIYNNISALQTEHIAQANQQHQVELAQMEKMRAIAVTEHRDLLEKVGSLETHNNQLINTMKQATAQHAVQLEEKQSALEALEGEVSLLSKKLDNHHAYTAERIQLLESENITVSGDYQKMQKIKNQMVNLVYSYAIDGRCSMGNSALLWLREIAESRDTVLFVIINNTIPDVISGIAGLYTSILEAQKNNISIVFAANRKKRSRLHSSDGSVYNITMRSSSVMPGEHIFDNVAVLVVPRRSTEQDDVSCFVFIKELPASSPSSVQSMDGQYGEGLEEEEKDLLEAAANLTSKLLCQQTTSAAPPVEDNTSQHLARYKAYEKTIAKYQEVYNIGKLMLSKQFHSLAEIASASEKFVSDLLHAPYLYNIQHNVSVQIYENNNGKSKDVVRNGNSIHVPILSIFKKRIVGQIAVERVLRTADGQMNALSVQDLLMTDLDEELLSIMAFFIAFIISKLYNVSQALASVEEASNTILVMQDAYNNLQQQYVDGIDNQMEYEDCMKVSHDVLALAANKRTHLSQLLEHTQTELSKLTKSTLCAIYLPLAHEVAAEVLLSGCDELEGLKDLPQAEERTGYVSYFPYGGPIGVAVYPQFESSDIEHAALQDGKIRVNALSATPCWSVRRHGDQDVSQESTVLAIPFAIHQQLGHEDERSQSTGLLVMTKPAAFSKIDLDIVKHLLRLLTYGMLHRIQHQVSSNNLSKLRHLQEALVKYEMFEGHCQLLANEQEYLSNAMDLLCPLLDSLQQHAAAISDEQEDRRDEKSYLLDCIQAVFYLGHVEDSNETAFHRLRCDDVLQAGEIVLKLGILQYNGTDDQQDYRILPSDVEAPGGVAVGLLKLDDLHVMVKFGKLPSKRMLVCQLNLLSYAHQVYSRYTADSKQYAQMIMEQMVNQQSQQRQHAEELQIKQEELLQMQADHKDALERQTDQHTLAMLAKKKKYKINMNIHIELILLLDQMSNLPAISHGDLAGLLGPMLEIAKYKYADASYQRGGLVWTRNDSKLSIDHWWPFVHQNASEHISIFATGSVNELYDQFSPAFREAVHLHPLPAVSADSNVLIILIPYLDTLLVLQGEGKSVFFAVVYALLCFLLALLNKHEQHLLNNANRELHDTNQLLAVKSIHFKLAEQRHLKQVVFLTMKVSVLHRKLVQCAADLQAYANKTAKLAHDKQLSDDCMLINQQIRGLQCFKGMQTLWEALQSIVTAVVAAYSAHDCGLMVWVDANNHCSFSRSDEGYRLIELGSTESALSWGNRVHATLMDIFDPSSRLESIYLVHRHAASSMEDLIYLIPVVSQQQAIAVLRVTVKQQLDAMVTKRLESSLIHLAGQLSPWLLYCRAYEEISVSSTSNKVALTNTRHALDGLTVDVQAFAQMTAVSKELASRLGEIAMKAAKSSLQGVVEEMRSALERALDCSVQIMGRQQDGWVYKEDLFDGRRQVMGCLSCSKDVRQLLQPFVKTINSILLVAMHSADAQAQSLESNQHREELVEELAALRTSMQALEESLAQGILIQRQQEKYIDLCSDVIEQLSKSAEKRCMLTDCADLLGYLQKLADQFLELLGSQGTMVSMALINSTDSIVNLEARELVWIHSHEQWEELPESLRLVAVSLVNTCIEQKQASAVDIGQYHVLTVPVQRMDVLGALQVIGKQQDDSALLADLSAILGRLLSSCLHQESMSVALADAQITTVALGNQLQDEHSALAFQSMQSALYKDLMDFFLTVLSHPSLDVLEVIADNRELMEQMAEHHLLIQGSGQATDQQVVSKTTISLQGLSLDILFVHVEGIEKHLLLSFAYNLMESVSAYLTIISSMHTAHAGHRQDEVSWKEQQHQLTAQHEQVIAKYKAKLDKTYGKYKTCQAALEAMHSTAKEIATFSADSTLSKVMGDMSKQMTAFAEGLLHADSMQRVLAMGESLLRQVQAAGPQHVAATSLSLLLAEPTEEPSFRCQVLTAHAQRDVSIVRDSKLAAIRGPAAVTQSLVDQCFQGHAGNQLYSNAVAISPTDLIAIDGLLGTGPIRVICSPIAGKGVLRLVIQYHPTQRHIAQENMATDLMALHTTHTAEITASLQAIYLDGLLSEAFGYLILALSQQCQLQQMQQASNHTELVEELASCKIAHNRLKKLHKICNRECFVLLDPLPLSLTPLQATQATAVKLLQIIRNLLRSEGQVLILRHESAYNVLYSGDAVVYQGVLPNSFGALSLPHVPSLVGDVLTSRQPILLTDIAAHAHYNPSVDGLYGQRCSFLAVPLRGKSSSILGLLFAVRCTDKGFDKEDQVAMDCMANIAALALHWCQEMSGTQHQLHKAVKKIGKLEKVLASQQEEG